MLLADLAGLGQDLRWMQPGSRELALTFDDGPNDPWTLRLLEVLERHSVKATFFHAGKVRGAETRNRSSCCAART